MLWLRFIGKNVFSSSKPEPHESIAANKAASIIMLCNSCVSILQIAQLLLKHGADVTLRNYDGQSSLEVAPPMIKQMILDHVTQSTTYTPQKLLQASWIGNHEIVRHFLVSFCQNWLVVKYPANYTLAPGTTIKNLILCYY